jgi:hypothetical protein
MFLPISFVFVEHLDLPKLSNKQKALTNKAKDLVV